MPEKLRRRARLGPNSSSPVLGSLWHPPLRSSRSVNIANSSKFWASFEPRSCLWEWELTKFKGSRIISSESEYPSRGYDKHHLQSSTVESICNRYRLIKLLLCESTFLGENFLWGFFVPLRHHRLRKKLIPSIRRGCAHRFRPNERTYFKLLFPLVFFLSKITNSYVHSASGGITNVFLALIKQKWWLQRNVLSTWFSVPLITVHIQKWMLSRWHHTLLMRQRHARLTQMRLLCPTSLVVRESFQLHLSLKFLQQIY